MKNLLGSLAALALAGLACGVPAERPAGPPAVPHDHASKAVPAPMPLQGKAYDSASLVALPAQQPEESEGLHNVYHLSEDIVSGSEPHGEEALRKLKEMGIRTIISVDGSEPNAPAAAAMGMKYVHIPIQYSGITEEELLRLTKSYRELEGPFYVHCFHGKHRGPAAAAVGRLVLDGVPRETAIAEMRQYCGTSSKYEGLYRAIALSELPIAERTERYDYRFDPVKHPEGIVGYMVAISRAHDSLLELRERGWAADPEHPDADALNEAAKLRQAFDGVSRLRRVKDGPDDLRAWFEASRDHSARLDAALQRFRAGDGAAAEEARASFTALKQQCSECHAAYRD